MADKSECNNPTDGHEQKYSETNTDIIQASQQPTVVAEPVNTAEANTTDNVEPSEVTNPEPQIINNTVSNDDAVPKDSSEGVVSNTDVVNNTSEEKQIESTPPVERQETRIESMETSSGQDDVQHDAIPKSTPVQTAYYNPNLLPNSYCKDEPDLLESVRQNASDKKLIDRLLGCAYGQALGDAYGLATEFQDRYRVDNKYPSLTKLIPFPNYVKNGHNSRWRQGDWTDDTDQWILILDTLVFHNGDVKVFAKKLKDWIYNGYPELGDNGGMGLGANVSQVVRFHSYLEDPLTASETVWELGGRKAAPNGAVMRCSASAFVHFNDREKVIETAEQMSKTTHFDPRCIASCLAVCLAITYLLTEENVRDDIEGLIKRVQDETIEIIGDRFTDQDRQLFQWHTNVRTLEELQLDEPNSIGYTYKCLASGFYGLRSECSFEKTLNDLIRYGGDADTNGAVCGTMYGARYGYKALPAEWLRAMPYKKWLDKKLIECLEKMNVIAT